MIEAYKGIEKDAFALASAYFGIMEMVVKGASPDDVIRFLADRDTTDLPEVAARVLNGGKDMADPIDCGALIRIATIDGKTL